MVGVVHTLIEHLAGQSLTFSRTPLLDISARTNPIRTFFPPNLHQLGILAHELYVFIFTK